MKAAICVITALLLSACDRHPTTKEFEAAKLECDKLGMRTVTLPFSNDVGCYSGAYFYAIESSETAKEKETK